MTRTLTTMTAIAALSLGLVACGGGEEEQASNATGASSQGQASPPEPVAQIDTLTGRNTRVTLDPGFTQALERLELTPSPVGDATISQEGVAELPITGGDLTYYKPGTVSPFVQGEIQHVGSGLALESGEGKRVELTNFEVDPGASVLTGTVSVDGEERMTNAPLFFLDGSTLQPLRTGANGAVAVLEGTTVELKAEAAQQLNEIFDTDALEEGLVVGNAKITVDTGGT